jgi:hypothetical protein
MDLRGDYACFVPMPAFAFRDRRKQQKPQSAYSVIYLGFYWILFK